MFGVFHAKKTEDQFDEKESQARFEAVLRGGLNTPHKPLKEKPVTKKKKKAKKNDDPVLSGGY